MRAEINERSVFMRELMEKECPECGEDEFFFTSLKGQKCGDCGWFRDFDYELAHANGHEIEIE